MNKPPTSPVRSLEARAYTDPAVFEHERQDLLAHTWQFACHASAIPNPGDYTTFEIAGENLFCIRGKDGQIRAFYNVCQHRAHELVSGDGNCRAVVCPYHAWAYELDGRLRSGPNLDASPGFDKPSVCLTEIQLEDFHGFLFANLDDNAEPMEAWYPKVRDQLGDFVPDIDDLAPLEWIEVEEACNWKVSVENYSECYHCQLNHRAFASGVVRPDTYDIQPQGYCLRHTTECQNLDAMSYPVDPSANPTAGLYSSWFLWPGFSFQVYPGNVLNTYHWRPNAVDRVTVWRGWYTPGGVDSDVIRRLAQQDRATTVEEDLHLVESVQRGMNSRGYQPGPLVLDPKGGVMSEHSLVALQSWMRDAIS